MVILKMKVKVIDMDEKGIVCPLLKSECLEDKCAWFSPSGQCAVVILTRAFANVPPRTGLGPLR